MAKNYVARQDANWKVISTSPDVCKTPRGDSTPPVPYPVTADMGTAVQVVDSVMANGKPLLILDQSFIPRTKGDAPGTAKGVASGTTGDICEPLAHSSTVRAGGKPVLRHDDAFWMNARNTRGIITGQPPAADVTAQAADPAAPPETPEEQGFLEALFRAGEYEARSRRQAAQDMTGAADAAGGFFTDHTPDGIMNSQAIGALLSASAYYNTTPEAAQAMAAQIGGEAADTFTALNTPENRSIMTAVQSLFMAWTLRAAGGTDRDGANIRGKTEAKKGEGDTPEYASCTREGDPVDVGSGDLIQRHSVLALPGSLPLTLTRLYRSRSPHCGLFGRKWSDDWSVSLSVHGKNLHYKDPEGAVLYYPLPWNGVFRDARNARQPHYRLNGDIRDELTVFDRRSQLTRVFSPAGSGVYLLSAIHDSHGNRISFLRRDNLLTEIRHSDGYTLTLDWQQQQLMSIDLVAPQHQRLVTCRYDNNDYLTECDTFQFTHLWHDYTPDGFMTRWRDTDRTCVDIGYDAQGRAVSTRSTEGYYDDRFIYDDAARCTTYLDAEGGESRYWYNEDGLVIRSTDPLGREEITEWENTRLISRTDALGRTTSYDYNDEGDIRRVALPGGYSLYYDHTADG
ncbi:PAAR-like domain-containing protein [Enterobacter sp.]|uniref:PAAR-like domain-containing protein n=1 Tax=Enterobacter sp. TaxID=42895 RepID=UPI00296ED489|nr:PAAR-like domain-containing protein [Enterobacter sp.]